MSVRDMNTREVWVVEYRPLGESRDYWLAHEIVRGEYVGRNRVAKRSKRDRPLYPRGHMTQPLTTRRELVCNGAIAWEQITGMLVKRDGYHHAICEKCRRPIRQRKSPPLGKICGGPAPGKS